MGPSVRAEFGPTITWEMGFQLGLFERVAEATPHLALFPALAAEPEKALAVLLDDRPTETEELLSFYGRYWLSIITSCKG